MIYITGDVHGEIERFREKPIKKLKEKDFLIITGDFGFIWTGDKEERKRLDWLRARKYTILFVDGAHENYSLLRDYPIEERFGSVVRHLGGNIYQLLKGRIYTIEGKTFYAFGGGAVNREAGREDELLAQEIKDGELRLDEVEHKVDYIVTHEASASLTRFLNIEEAQFSMLSGYFDRLSKDTEFKKWYFGCYHMDKEIPPKYMALFKKVLKIG